MNTSANRADETDTDIDCFSLKLLLPFRVAADESRVRRMVVETKQGSFGILPRRLDCAAALVPGILMYETESRGEIYWAVDEGVLVKTGQTVSVAVRNAVGGADLGRLREAVERDFAQVDERERSVRTTLAKLEIGFVRRFAEFTHE